MKRSNEIYRCKHCGNMFEFLEASGVNPVCCGDPVEHLIPKTADASGEKHVPHIEEVEDGYIVRVGKEIDHPMTDGHWIQFVELIIDGEMIQRVHLSPVAKPEVYIKTFKGLEVEAREYCNLHGLWSSKG